MSLRLGLLGACFKAPAPHSPHCDAIRMSKSGMRQQAEQDAATAPFGCADHVEAPNLSSGWAVLFNLGCRLAVLTSQCVSTARSASSTALSSAASVAQDKLLHILLNSVCKPITLHHGPHRWQAQHHCVSLGAVGKLLPISWPSLRARALSCLPAIPRSRVSSTEPIKIYAARILLS